MKFTYLFDRRKKCTKTNTKGVIELIPHIKGVIELK